MARQSQVRPPENLDCSALIQTRGSPRHLYRPRRIPRPRGHHHHHPFLRRRLILTRITSSHLDHRGDNPWGRCGNHHDRCRHHSSKRRTGTDRPLWLVQPRWCSVSHKKWRRCVGLVPRSIPIRWCAIADHNHQPHLRANLCPRGLSPGAGRASSASLTSKGAGANASWPGLAAIALK